MGILIYGNNILIYGNNMEISDLKGDGNNSWIVNGISMEHWQKIVVFLALWQ
jgi:hypothetical protein